MSSLFEQTALYGHLASQFAKQFPAKSISPPFPAVTSKPTSDNSAHEAQDVAVPYVNSMFKDDE